MKFFTQELATVRVWELIIVVALVLVSAILLMGYISGKMEERAAKKGIQPAPNSGVPASPQLATSGTPTQPATAATA